MSSQDKNKGAPSAAPPYFSVNFKSGRLIAWLTGNALTPGVYAVNRRRSSPTTSQFLANLFFTATNDYTDVTGIIYKRHHIIIGQFFPVFS